MSALAAALAEDAARRTGCPGRSDGSSPGLRPASRDRHLDRVDDELGPQVGAHRPADDPAAVAVDHRGEIEPALPGEDVLDVRDPELVRAGGLKSRSTRSSATRTPGTRMVVRAALRHQRPRCRCAASAARPACGRPGPSWAGRVDPAGAVGVAALLRGSAGSARTATRRQGRGPTAAAAPRRGSPSGKRRAAGRSARSGGWPSPPR